MKLSLNIFENCLNTIKKGLSEAYMPFFSCFIQYERKYSFLKKVSKVPKAQHSEPGCLERQYFRYTVRLLRMLEAQSFGKITHACKNRNCTREAELHSVLF